MGQCVDPLAMLPGLWDLVRTIESLWCGRASDGSKLMVLGDSTKAVVGWMIDGDGFLLRPYIYIYWWGRTISLVRNGFQLNR